MVKYNLLQKFVEAEIDLEDAASMTNGYQWGGYSGVDFATDEFGLWVLWSSPDNANRLKLAKVDVVNNLINQTWALNTGNQNTSLI